MSETTKQRYFIASESNYQKNRLSLHDDIVETLLYGMPAKKAPESILMGGGSASGKSVATKIIVTGFHHQEEEVVVIDPDEIKRQLPEYEQLKTHAPEQMADILHDESSDIAERLLGECISRKLNFIYDGTMKNLPKYQALIQRLKSNGYSISVVVVDIPLEEALKRAKDRYIVEGRLVPEDVIIESHTKVPETFYKIKDSVNNYTLFDNTELKLQVFAQKTDNLEIVISKERLRQFYNKAGINDPQID